MDKRMGMLIAVAAAACWTLSIAPAQAAKDDNKCNLARYAELPITMAGTRPLISGTVNGVKATFLIDSGASYSVLSKEAAARFQLNLGGSITMSGTSGMAQGRVGKARDFSLVGMQNNRIFHDVEFAVIGNADIYGSGADGLIGQNVFGQGAMEFDLANGFVRLFLEENCGSKSLAYWHGESSVAVMDIRPFDKTGHHVIGTGTLNDKKIRVVFDSGAARSILTLQAASRAGIKPDDEDAKAAGYGKGIGSKIQETSVARFESLDLGGEKILNARLLMGSIAIDPMGDMLLGADFFLSHRIVISGAQRKVYFTYNGGRVFDLGDHGRAEQSAMAAAGASLTASEASIGELPKTQLSKATRDLPALPDAESYRRRAAASIGRQDFASAIADFDSAIKLDSADAESYFQRGLAKLHDNQGKAAFDDFDHVLTLNPEHVQALVERGRIRLAIKKVPEARSDFDAALRLSPGDVSMAPRIAKLYAQYDQIDEALTLLNLWITQHPKDEHLADVLNGRCRLRVMARLDLDVAIDDCTTAIKKGARRSEVYANRGLAFLSRGDVDKAADDFKSALKLQPKDATALYGLGIVDRKRGSLAAGDKNIQLAIATTPSIMDVYKRLELTP